jgi:hypothetical protein
VDDQADEGNASVRSKVNEDDACGEHWVKIQWDEGWR